MIEVQWDDALAWYCLGPVPHYCELSDVIAAGDMINRAIFNPDEIDRAFALGLASGAVTEGEKYSYAITEDWCPLIDEARQIGEHDIDGVDYLYRRLQEEFEGSCLELKSCIPEAIYFDAVKKYKARVRSVLNSMK